MATTSKSVTETLVLYPSGTEIGTVTLDPRAARRLAPYGGIGTVPLGTVRDYADLAPDYRDLPDDQLVCGW